VRWTNFAAAAPDTRSPRPFRAAGKAFAPRKVLPAAGTGERLPRWEAHLRSRGGEGLVTSKAIAATETGEGLRGGEGPAQRGQEAFVVEALIAVRSAGGPRSAQGPPCGRDGEKEGRGVGRLDGGP